ncbi:hypothetical protein IX91_25855 (plasmid) [Vibrio tubiashii ATCC 19109]|uniref:Uncharacterized protein n=1 Tax=Vibrio tubiashii ATCC 19109 TaxID=1051646 RepID=F9T6S1_9VIBR|nr:hypothetical protein [Vibrio tubiashii]AIW17485.1 hypothetical protein IX91_25855 [Vibrio tubiashii ATCC 19109]EGU54476.1 hypothetical protein VITU9109_02842 [Vibrio tubiashii ATCC 19109]EIF06001.1 hypothetical protein VT1337_00640 [Vibrio tubiashii NCIMB 1337 = ATCC 19106]
MRKHGNLLEFCLIIYGKTIANKSKILHFAVEIIANGCIFNCNTRQGVTNVDIETVTQKIKQEIESKDFKLQAVFDRNIESIEALKNDGYSYKAVYSRLGGLIELSHFRDLVYRAKKKRSNTPSSANRLQAKKNQHEQMETLAQEDEMAANEAAHNTSHTKKDWQKVGVRSEKLISELMGNGITPEMVSKWDCANEMGVSKKLVEYLIKQK